MEEKSTCARFASQAIRTIRHLPRTHMITLHAFECMLRFHLRSVYVFCICRGVCHWNGRATEQFTGLRHVCSWLTSVSHADGNIRRRSHMNGSQASVFPLQKPFNIVNWWTMVSDGNFHSRLFIQIIKFELFFIKPMSFCFMLYYNDMYTQSDRLFHTNTLQCSGQHIYTNMQPRYHIDIEYWWYSTMITIICIFWFELKPIYLDEWMSSRFVVLFFWY